MFAGSNIDKYIAEWYNYYIISVVYADDINFINCRITADGRIYENDIQMVR